MTGDTVHVRGTDRGCVDAAVMARSGPRESLYAHASDRDHVSVVVGLHRPGQVVLDREGLQAFRVLLDHAEQISEAYCALRRVERSLALHPDELAAAFIAAQQKLEELNNMDMFRCPRCVRYSMGAPETDDHRHCSVCLSLCDILFHR